MTMSLQDPEDRTCLDPVLGGGHGDAGRGPGRSLLGRDVEGADGEESDPAPRRQPWGASWSCRGWSWGWELSWHRSVWPNSEDAPVLNCFLGLWFGLGLAADLGFGAWARHKLLTEFRLAATQRYEPLPGFWKRLLGRKARESAKPG